MNPDDALEEIPLPSKPRCLPLRSVFVHETLVLTAGQAGHSAVSISHPYGPGSGVCHYLRSRSFIRRDHNHTSQARQSSRRRSHRTHRGVAMHNTNGHGPKRAILYARVSTEEQARSGYSLAQQVEDMHGLRTSTVPGSRKFGACEGRAGVYSRSGPSERRQWGASRSSPNRSEDMATWQMRRATQMPYRISRCGDRRERWAASYKANMFRISCQ
jgi:hypothetical protein